MARSDKEKNGKKKRHDQGGEGGIASSISPGAARSVGGVVLIALSGFLLLSQLGFAGKVGTFVYSTLYSVLGVGYLLLPLSLVLLAILLFQSFERRFGALQIGSIGIFLLSGLGLISLAFPGGGGFLGAFISSTLVAGIATPATIIFLVAAAIVALILAFDIHLAALIGSLIASMRAASNEKQLGATVEPSVIGIPLDEETSEEEPVLEEPKNDAELRQAHEKVQSSDAEGGFPIIAATTRPYMPPPISILAKNKGKPEVGDVKANMNIIKRTLQNFGIQVEMDEASIGPTVTRYAMKPAEGVRLSKIVALQSNLELALAAAPVRIEAPIPGKSLVGIEVPNISRTTLGLAPLVAEESFASSDRPLLIALGRSITGQPHFADLARMPHLLVAGTTGAGKTCGKDTYVFSEKGMLTFEELCPLPLNSETNYALRVATRDGIETTSKNYNNGICDFYKITTEEGLSIEITAEHPLWVIRNAQQCWQNGGSMQIGEYVAISRGSKIFGRNEPIHFTPEANITNKARPISIPSVMSKELGLFMGLLTADGSLTVKNRVVYTQANDEVIKIYRTLLKDLFGIDAPNTAKSGQSNKAIDIVVHSKQLKDFLAHLGLTSAGAKTKEIPRSIRQAGPDVIRAFIQGLIRNDGHISAKRGLEILLANEKLLKQMQIILLNFGIVSGVHAKRVKGYEENSYTRLTIYGADFAIYAHEIGFLTDDESRRAQQALDRKRNTNKNTIPTLAPILKKISLAYRSAFARLTQAGWQYNMGALVPKYAFRSLPSYAAGYRNPSYEALGNILTFYKPLASTLEYQQLDAINENNFYWAKVARIEKTSGVGYDFEVPGSHSFVGNGFINHNSVAIHDFIVSLLYRCGPERLRFIMVDPKRVELTVYNSIPHLLTPVITDAKKAILALKWLSKEMERRYNILETERVRDIASYHSNVVAPALESAGGGSASGGKADGDTDEKLPEAMPYIVLIIDELADIMTAYPRELEAGIVRLAQMSRAVGIHLVLSTQRPSVKVITGLIKANIPARVALQVASQIDSRTILDMGGAEKLLGSGDMLFLSGEMSKPRRIQAAFISETEVKKVVSHIVKENGGQLLQEIDFTDAAKSGSGPDSIFASMDNEGEDDERYEEARETVMQAGKASTSYLQRKMGIGYARAARLMDLLEERGVIGPGDGAKAREVIGLSGQEIAQAAPTPEKEPGERSVFDA